MPKDHKSLYSFYCLCSTLQKSSFNRTWKLSIVNLLLKSETEVMQIPSPLHYCLSNNHATLSLCTLSTCAIYHTILLSPKTKQCCVTLRSCTKEQNKYMDIFSSSKRLLDFWVSFLDPNSSKIFRQQFRLGRSRIARKARKTLAQRLLPCFR